MSESAGANSFPPVRPELVDVVVKNQLITLLGQYNSFEIICWLAEAIEQLAMV